jgi:hypothetical protein
MDGNAREAMDAAAWEVFGDLPVELTPQGVSFPLGLEYDGDTSQDKRPWANKIAELRRNPTMVTALLNSATKHRSVRYVKSILLRDAADKLFQDQNYKDASARYFMAARVMIGRDLPTGNGPFKLPEYACLSAGWQLADMMACLNGAAASLVKLEQYKQVRYDFRAE